ncbi:MAG: 30S ribosomal protein S20 [Planctomycetota bacterium]
MAHSKQAIKRIRTSDQQRIANKARMSRLKTEVKKLQAAIAEGDKSKATELLPTICKVIDKAAKQNIIHKHNASRRKGHAMRAVASMS